MEWSPEQDAALRAVDRWFRDPDAPQVFRLFGYAGSGKTTLARHFAENVDGTVLFAAYTGKAAHVMRQKGCYGASTIHSLIYHTREKSRAAIAEIEASMTRLREAGGEQTPEFAELAVRLERERLSLSQPTFKLNTASDILHASLVVIDECSMIDGRMGEDLLWYGTKVLVLGDPAQLPPVAGTGFFTDHTPDFMLTDIHRQARDNPIIHLATTVRNGGRLELGHYGDSVVRSRSGGPVDPAEVMAADQVLVGKNVTRHASNARVRTLLGRDSTYPVIGDRLVCLRNNHDKGLLNGQIWHAKFPGPVYEDKLILDVYSDDNAEFALSGLLCHAHHFEGTGKTLTWWERSEAEEFDYGYALTVHKAQGSQFENVFLFDESGVFREDARRWLYTGITRAAEKLTVVI